MIEKTNGNNDYKPWGMETNQFCMLMHLSQLVGYVVPIAGLVLPIVMWATNKEKSELVDKNGKNILNWIISSIIYVIISMILMFVFIGFVTLILFMICALIFTIIGAVRANNGEVYRYPLAMPFIK